MDLRWPISVSDQVKSQLKYLINHGTNGKKFTVLDSRNCILYAVNSDFSLFNHYEVVLGRDPGEDIKTKTFKDYLRDDVGNGSFYIGVFIFLWNIIGKNHSKKLDGYIDDFFKPWNENKKQTTSAGIFRRMNWFTDNLNNFILTRQSEIYGKRYISWETVKWQNYSLDGKEIPLGFHGTEQDGVIDFQKQEWSDRCLSNGRRMEWGCILFKEKDIIEINKFINFGDYSFWMSSLTDNIMLIEKDIWHL